MKLCLLDGWLKPLRTTEMSPPFNNAMNVFESNIVWPGWLKFHAHIVPMEMLVVKNVCRIACAYASNILITFATNASRWKMYF